MEAEKEGNSTQAILVSACEWQDKIIFITNRGSKRGTILTVIRQKVKYNKYNTDPEHNMSKFFNYIIHLYSTYYEWAVTPCSPPTLRLHK